MVLTSSEILDILKNKPNRAILEEAVKESKKLTAHITGKGSKELLTQISGLENKTQLELRQKYAKTNKDLFARIHRPEDKIFTAKGGSAYFDMNDRLKKDFILRLKDVYNGFSIKQWVECFAKQYLHTDPMGLVFMEVGFENAYPTYKSTSKIFDYKLKGRDVEYVVFYTDKPDEFRVVDDNFDYLVKFDGESVQTYQEQTYPNYFGKVPAKIISNILLSNTESYTSPDWEIIELADEFLREGSVKSIFKLKHGFPKAWQYQSICTSCKGSGFIEGVDCKTCNGTGFAVAVDASQVISLPIPTGDQPTIAPNIAGYASPDIEGWDKMTDEQSLLEYVMTSTYWGTKDHVKTQGIREEKTATEIISDAQPIHDRLMQFSKWAEDIEVYITDMLGEFYYNSSYKGASIHYGKRYNIESPDAIWTKYENAREKGSPVSVLDELLTEYYYSKYNSNSMELNKYLKLMKVEPFIHQTISDAKMNVLDQVEYNRKLYFSQWLGQMNEMDIIRLDVKALTESLTEFTKDKQIIVQ